MYKRVLLKISGEQLAGKFETGFDPERAAWLAHEVKSVIDGGTQVIIVVGGGNFVRGTQIVGSGIKRVTADQMGMLATLINAVALTDIFEVNGLPTRCLSNIYAQQVAESFVHRLAEKHLEAGRVVVVAGGIGRPYLTTDTGAIALALELSCEIAIKSTKVDGIYDKDPIKHPGSTRFESLSYQQAVESKDIKAMDKAALGLAMEQNMPLLVLSLEEPGNLKKAVQGQPIGTKVS